MTRRNTCGELDVFVYGLNRRLVANCFAIKTLLPPDKSNYGKVFGYDLIITSGLRDRILLSLSSAIA